MTRWDSCLKLGARLQAIHYEFRCYARVMPVKIGIPVWLIKQNVTLQSSAITLCVIDPSSKKENSEIPLCSSAAVHAHKLCDYRTDLYGSLPRHNRLKGGIRRDKNFFPHPPSLVPSHY